MLCLTQPSPVCSRIFKGEKERSGAFTAMAKLQAAAGKAVWHSICTVHAPLHALECGGAPRQAQAVAIPMGMRHSEECCFYLTSTFQNAAPGDSIRPAREGTCPSDVRYIAFENLRGPVGLTLTGNLWRDSHASGRGGCAFRTCRIQVNMSSCRFTSFHPSLWIHQGLAWDVSAPSRQ